MAFLDLLNPALPVPHCHYVLQLHRPAVVAASSGSAGAEPKHRYDTEHYGKSKKGQHLRNRGTELGAGQQQHLASYDPSNRCRCDHSCPDSD